LHQISIYSFRMDGKKTKGAVLQQAVESYCRKNGCGNPEDSAWEVRKTDKGKPFFVNQPGRYLSVTDSGRTRMIALGECPVGIDLQLPETRGGKNRTREEQCLVLAGRWFHPEESCWIAGAADFQTEDGRCARKSLQQINSGTGIFSGVTGRFFQVWTGKEAYVKYTGSGIDRDFSRFSVMDPAFPAFLSWFAVRAEDREGREKNALLCVCTGEKAEIYVQ
jgi:phosphopantetheinyl transferase